MYTHIYLHQWSRKSLFHVMTCCLFGAKPLPKPMLNYCWITASWNLCKILKFQFQNIICNMSAILIRPQHRKHGRNRSNTNWTVQMSTRRFKYLSFTLSLCIQGHFAYRLSHPVHFHMISFPDKTDWELNHNDFSPVLVRYGRVCGVSVTIHPKIGWVSNERLVVNTL